MLLALIAAVSLGSMPVQIDREFWFDARRFPATGSPYWAKIALTVDANGNGVARRVVVASGERRLDAMICTMPLKTARFRPAVGPDGQAVAAVVERAFALNMGSPPPTLVPATDFAIPVSHIPDSATTPFITLRLITDTDNKVSGCFILKSTGNRTLDQLACPATMTLDLPPIQNAAGITLRAMRDISVTFIATPPSAAYDPAVATPKPS